jgi:hypothetical protein
LISPLIAAGEDYFGPSSGGSGSDLLGDTVSCLPTRHPCPIHYKSFANVLGFAIVIHRFLAQISGTPILVGREEMEKVEGLMKGLKLSAEEERGLSLKGKEEGGRRETELQALGKVLSEKPVFADGITSSLGRVWCPLKGVRCKEMGANVFLFTFLQESGKRKALFDGPWKVNNDLIVMVDFDPAKSVEEYVFDTIPIWIRVMKLPLGWMNRDTGMDIGDSVGEAVEVETEEDGTAVGEFLRIKVRINIKKPLMRGIAVNVGEKG